MAKCVYDIIKKQNGETFARTLRDNNLLDIPDIVNIVKYAGRDASRLIPYLWGLRTFNTQDTGSPADPFELLHQAGYEFVEYANTYKKQNAIKKYFRKDEKLCTFDDKTRFKENYIINAVKRDADKIKPSKHPKRQDIYGTSVISIQIKKNGKGIKITNRYNHTINQHTDPEHPNPDNTFDSNPDNIIMGLSAALKARFNIDWQANNSSLPDGFALIGDKIIHVVYQDIDKNYMGDKFWVKDGIIYPIDQNSQVIMDYMIWDSKLHKLSSPLLPNLYRDNDCFIDMFNKFVANKTVTVQGRAPNQTILVNGEKIIEINDNKIATVTLNDVRHIGDNFLYHCANIREINLPNVETIGNDFLSNNTTLKSIDLPNVTQIGNSFLVHNNGLLSINLPNVVTIGVEFLFQNINLLSIDLPKVTKIGGGFLCQNTDLHSINIPNVTEIPNWFLYKNTALKSINLPNVTKIYNWFLYCNRILKSINAPKVTEIGSKFLFHNIELRLLNLPQVKRIDYNFMPNAPWLQSVNLPNLQHADIPSFLSRALLNSLTLDLYIPQLDSVRLMMYSGTRCGDILQYFVNISKIRQLEKSAKNLHDKQRIITRRTFNNNLGRD